MPINERSLWVRLGLSSKQYDRGLDRAEKRQDKFKKQTAQLGTAIKGAIAGIGVAAVGQYISTVIRAQTETQQWADRIGIGVEALQELQFAGKKYGITQDAITDGLKELSLRTDEFVKTGIGPAAEAFKRLGLEQEELNKVSGDTEKLFELVHSRIQEVGNVAARQRIADEIFGGQGGEQFVELLSTSSVELNGIRQEARDMGAVVDKEASKSIEKLSTNIKNLGSAISGTSGSIVGEMAPALNKMVQGLTTAISHTDNLFTLLSTGVKASLGVATRKDLKAALESGKSILGLSKEINNQLGGAIQEGLAGLGPGKATGGTKGGALAQMITGGGGNGGDDTGGGGTTGPAPTLSGAGQFSFQGATFTPKTADVIKATNNEAAKLGVTLKNQVTPSMDATIKKTNQTGNVIQGTFAEGIQLGGLFSNVFAGMQNVIQSSLDSSKGFLESFGKFFADFIKGMIMKLIAAAAAAFVLALAIQAITGGVAGGFGAAFGQAGSLLGGTAGNITGAMGLADGGQLKKSGTFIVGERGPEAVTMPSGSTVRPLSNVPSGAGEGRLVAVVTGEQLNFIQEKYNRKKGNTY